MPPAPALISSCASRKSSGPREQRAKSERFDLVADAHPASRSTSAAMLVVGLDGEHLVELRRRSARVPRSRRRGRSSSSAPLTCCTTACARSPDRSRIRPRPCALRAASACPAWRSRSKIPPQLERADSAYCRSCRARSVSAIVSSLRRYDTSRPALPADGSRVTRVSLQDSRQSAMSNLPRRRALAIG